MSVLLPAPFSPRSAWISPGSTTRSMWSLATSEPNRLVIPRSSSFTATPDSTEGGPDSTEGGPKGEVCGQTGLRACPYTESLDRRAVFAGTRGYLGWLGEVIWILPL